MEEISVFEASKLLELSQSRIKSLCANSELVARKDGKSWRIDKDSVIAMRALKISAPVATERAVSSVESPEALSKLEYERRIKREDWKKRERENKIKSREYGKISSMKILNREYFRELMDSLREILEAECIQNSINPELTNKILKRVQAELPAIHDRFQKKLDNAHVD